MTTAALPATYMVASHEPPSRCPITWCTQDHRSGLDQDHCAATGGHAWPGVLATGDPHELVTQLSPAPTWAVEIGLEPAVALFVERLDTGDGASVDLRPDEARELAAGLIRAADAAEATGRYDATPGESRNVATGRHARRFPR